MSRTPLPGKSGSTPSVQSPPLSPSGHEGEDVDELVVAILGGMGFSRAVAENALMSTNSTNMDHILNYILAMPAQTDGRVDDLLTRLMLQRSPEAFPTQDTNANSPGRLRRASTSDMGEEIRRQERTDYMLAQLTEMGYTLDDALGALDATGSSSVDEAVDYINTDPHRRAEWRAMQKPNSKTDLLKAKPTHQRRHSDTNNESFMRALHSHKPMEAWAETRGDETQSRELANSPPRRTPRFPGPATSTATGTPAAPATTPGTPSSSATMSGLNTPITPGGTANSGLNGSKPRAIPGARLGVDASGRPRDLPTNNGDTVLMQDTRTDTVVIPSLQSTSAPTTPAPVTRFNNTPTPAVPVVAPSNGAILIEPVRKPRPKLNLAGANTKPADPAPAPASAPPVSQRDTSKTQLDIASDDEDLFPSEKENNNRKTSADLNTSAGFIDETVGVYISQKGVTLIGEEGHETETFVPANISPEDLKAMTKRGGVVFKTGVCAEDLVVVEILGRGGQGQTRLGWTTMRITWIARGRSLAR